MTESTTDADDALKDGKLDMRTKEFKAWAEKIDARIDDTSDIVKSVEAALRHLSDATSRLEKSQASVLETQKAQEDLFKKLASPDPPGMAKLETTMQDLSVSVTDLSNRMKRDEAARADLRSRLAFSETITSKMDPANLLDKKDIVKLVTDAIKDEVHTIKYTANNAGQLKSTLNPAFGTFADSFNKPKMLRLDSGRLNFELKHGTAARLATLSERERGILKQFPQMILKCDAPETKTEAAFKNKVTFPKECKLDVADEHVFYKLAEMQVHLKQFLIPYQSWAKRVALELSGDFRQLRDLIEALPEHETDWTLFIEGICQVMHDHQVVYSSFSKFTALFPFPEEVYSVFARRLRDAFHLLSAEHQTSDLAREILLDKLRTFLPSVYSIIQRHLSSSTAADLVEETVVRAKLHDHKAVEEAIFSTPVASVQLQGSSAPVYSMTVTAGKPGQPGRAEIVPQISDPRSDNHRDVFPSSEHVCCGNCGTAYAITEGHCNGFFVGAARENDNRCFNCGQLGHYAMNCPKPPKKYNTGPPASKKVTITGDLFENTRDKIRSAFKGARNNRGGGRGGNRGGNRNGNNSRVHFVGPDDDTDAIKQSPAERILADIGDDELRDLIEEQLAEIAAEEAALEDE